MPLRLRLTIWYSAILAGILAIFGGGVYFILDATLTSQLDQTLNATAADILHNISVSSVLDIHIVSLPRNLQEFGGPNVYVQVWRADGGLVRQSENLGSYSVPLDAAALRRDSRTRSDVHISGVHLRVLTTPILRSTGQTIGYIQTAISMRTLDQAKNMLLFLLISGGALAVCAAALVSWLTVQRALQPLDAITQTALQITRADDLSRRITWPENRPLDEVGRLAQAFNESLERLERLFNTQRRFLADVSHELRTPLTIVRGNLDLLCRMGTADSTSLDAIQAEVDRMSRLVGDLMLLAQAESGSLPLARKPVELDTLLLEVFREAQILAGGVNMVVDEIDQALVIGDRDRLKQLLLNLVSNALKFTPDGGRVTLGLSRLNEWARVTISDTGVGIPPHELQRIFERFYRVDKARSRSLGGAGLGLAIAQRIARMHGGRIEAASEGIPGRGSTFCVWLPLAESKYGRALVGGAVKPAPWSAPVSSCAEKPRETA